MVTRVAIQILISYFQEDWEISHLSIIQLMFAKGREKLSYALFFFPATIITASALQVHSGCNCSCKL